jgi:1-acyl-sn-glycerol-3-phosphate acyltransferase
VITLSKLQSMSISGPNRGQRFFAATILGPNFHFPLKKTRVILEGKENLPEGQSVVFLMNHTDRFNYWPFQYQVWHECGRGTCAWVKGKYYENPVIEWLLDHTNNIPLPSKGYVVTKDFELANGRIPTDEEYSALKKHVDGDLSAEESMRRGGEAIHKMLEKAWSDTPSGKYSASVERRLGAMMKRLVELSEETISKKKNLLIFPQGTRSVHLLPGHTGAAQFILSAGVPAVPVGCNGSDLAYPGNLPLSRGGTITYRIGKPLTLEGELKPFKIAEPFTPFTRESEQHEAAFRGATDLIMSRINDLLDPPYQFAAATAELKGAKRFV